MAYPEMPNKYDRVFGLGHGRLSMGKKPILLMALVWGYRPSPWWVVRKERFTTAYFHGRRFALPLRKRL
jgi:hypothetical protein